MRSSMNCLIDCAVAKAAHKLKSSSKSVGALQLGEVCEKLEAAGNSNNWNEIEKLAPIVEPLMQEVKKYVDAL